MKNFLPFLFLNILLFILPSLSKKKNLGDFIQHFQQTEEDQLDWKTIYQKDESTKWQKVYDWKDEKPNFFACGISPHFSRYRNADVRDSFEYTMIPNNFHFTVCNFNDWKEQIAYGVSDENDTPELKCPESNFIVGFQWYWIPKEEVLFDSSSVEIFRLKIICSPSLNFIGFNEKETNDDMLLLQNEFVCGFQVGATRIETPDAKGMFSFANGLKIKLCKRPEIKNVWNLIEEGVYGKWQTPMDWSDRYLDYYACGINLFFLKASIDYRAVKGIDFVTCNMNKWEDQKSIVIKHYNPGEDNENNPNLILNSQKCSSQEFITGLQIKYGFSFSCKNALGIIGIIIQCGKTINLFENKWRVFITGINTEGIWREKKYLIGGICGASLKWNKDNSQVNCNEEENIGLSGMNVKVCPQLYKKDIWQKVFNLTEKISETISWKDDSNRKDYFGCGLILYTQKLRSPYMFLNPDFPMNISVIACKIDNWDEHFIAENLKNSNNDEFKTMCPPNEFIYGIQRYLRKSDSVWVEEEIKQDFFRLRIICGPSMKSFDVYPGNPNLHSMFFIEKTLDETIYFRNGLIGGYSYGFMDIAFALKLYKKVMKNVIGSLSFQIIPIFKKEEFFSHSLKKSWVSLSKVESNEGKWGTIQDWSIISNTFVSKYYFTFQNNFFLAGISLLISDINYKVLPGKYIIGKSLEQFNFTCEQEKFISGLQFKRARYDKTLVFVGYRILCEYFDGNSTFSDWSAPFETNIKGGYWEDPKILMYGGKKAFLCGVAPKTKEIFYENNNYKVINDLDLKMCSNEYQWEAKEEIIKLEGNPEGKWMEFEKKVRLEEEPDSNWMEFKDWKYDYYACGLRLSKSVKSNSYIEGIQFKFCYNFDRATKYFWHKIDSEFNGVWEKPHDCKDLEYIGGLQLQFRNLDDNMHDNSNQSEDDIENKNKGEIVGIRILCKEREYNRKNNYFEESSFQDQSWITIDASSIGIWGERNYLEKWYLICDVAGKKYEGKLNGLKIKICE